jgi:DNA invertase Pin-like site-specific DNA recombinase
MKPGRPSLAVGYVRVSTNEQRLGPDAQRAALAAWAAREGVELVAVFTDVVSGLTALERRPGLVAALAELGLVGAGVLVAVRRDRFARDVGLAARLGTLVRRSGAELRVVEGPPPGDSPEAVLLQQLVDAVAQFEAAVGRARTKAALQAKLARGEAAGGVPPLGYRIVRGRLVEDSDEQAALTRARQLQSEGLSLRKISLRLRVEGYRPRGTSWHVSTLHRALPSQHAEGPP